MSAVALLALAALILWAKLKDANLDKYTNFCFYTHPPLPIFLEMIAL